MVVIIKKRSQGNELECKRPVIDPWGNHLDFFPKDR